MVELVELGPCAEGAMVWRAGGRLRLTSIVKVAFTLPTTGKPVPAALPVLLKDDVLKDNMPTASVRAPSDWFPYRPRADVTLVGAAHAPAEKPVRKMQVRLTVTRDGKLLVNKSLEIRGDNGGEQPFTSMSIEYERAYGGLGFPDNPIGVGASAKDAPPNIVHPRDAEQAAGYGPISATWAGRRALRGALRRSQLDDPIVALPDGFDFTYFQAAPRDQQIDFLGGGEQLVFEGLHSAAQRVELKLPKARAVGAVFGLRAADGSDRTDVAYVCDTLHIDTDAHVFTLTFRGSVEITEAALGRVLVAAGVAHDGAALTVPARRPGAPVSSRQDPTPASAPASQDFGGTVLINPWANPAAHRPAATTAPQPAPATRAPAAAVAHKPVAESPFTRTVEISPDSGSTSTATPFAVAKPSSGHANAPSIEGAPWSKKPEPPARGDNPFPGALRGPDPPKPVQHQNVTAPLDLDERKLEAALAAKIAGPPPPARVPLPPEKPRRNTPRPQPRVIAAEPSANAPPIKIEPLKIDRAPAQPSGATGGGRIVEAPAERPAPWAAGPAEAPIAPPEPRKLKKMPKKLDANDLIYGGGGPKRKRK